MRHDDDDVLVDFCRRLPPRPAGLLEYATVGDELRHLLRLRQGPGLELAEIFRQLTGGEGVLTAERLRVAARRRARRGRQGNGKIPSRTP